MVIIKEVVMIIQSREQLSTYSYVSVCYKLGGSVVRCKYTPTVPVQYDDSVYSTRVRTLYM